MFEAEIFDWRTPLTFRTLQYATIQPDLFMFGSCPEVIIFSLFRVFNIDYNTDFRIYLRLTKGHFVTAKNVSSIAANDFQESNMFLRTCRILGSASNLTVNAWLNELW